MFEVDEDYSGPKNLVYEYSGYIDISKSQQQITIVHASLSGLFRYCI
jgi:hypothetical protein